MRIIFDFRSGVLILLAVLLTGCAGEDPREAEVGKSEDGIPVVVASNYPLKYFAETIGAGEIDVRLLVPTDIDPAMWRPTVEDISAMQEADLILLNGASYEPWLNIVSLPPSRIVNTTARLADQLIPVEADITHVHGLDGEHEHSGTAFTTWLDVQLAVGQVHAIADAYSERWPQLTAIFQSAASSLETELLTLDNDLARIVGGNQDLPILFSHPVYQYFERRYAINGESVHWEPDVMPDDSMWDDLEKLVIRHPAKWMIWEAEPSPEIASRLQELGISSIVYSPAANTPVQGGYISVMADNVTSLAGVFSSERK